jgi:NAD(P)-dependent dehydrogenase (short-subunit alcohol dehydrogenase family)
MAPQVTITAVDSFTGKLAVVTGGGSGIGRELVRQLAAQGCSVATCDLNPDSVAVTAATAWAAAPPGVAVTGHRCDVSDESQVQRFRDELLARHPTDHVDLVFSNAGVGGGGSFVNDSRQEWERTLNGTAKFAVRGFSAVLIEDLRTNAPKVRVAVVLPGFINTGILASTRRAHGPLGPEDMSDERAATIILAGVRSGAWRILVGKDVAFVDEGTVRSGGGRVPAW